MQISRRNALMGASAAAVVAGVPGAVQGGDAVLLAKVARFQELYEAWNRVWEKGSAHRARIEAMTDCPRVDPATQSRAHFAFLKAHDAYKHYDESNRLGQQTGALVNAIFKTPAETFRGAIEKFHIAHLAVGSGADDDDEDLLAYQDWAAPWMETVAADFERLLEGMQP